MKKGLLTLILLLGFAVVALLGIVVFFMPTVPDGYTVEQPKIATTLFNCSTDADCKTQDYSCPLRAVKSCSWSQFYLGHVCACSLCEYGVYNELMHRCEIKLR